MLPVDLPDTVREALSAPLVDQHCHGVRRDDLTRAPFETLISTGGLPAPPGTTHFDTPLGAAIRRWCAPVLDLEPHVAPTVYLARRAELGADEVNRRLLGAAGALTFLVDTGVESGELLSAAELGRFGSAVADEIIRIEQIEQDVAEVAEAALDYVDSLAEELTARAVGAVGMKTVVAHRCGLGFDPSRPARGSVLAAANRRLSEPKEPVTDPILLRHLLWTAVDVARERGLPLQVHAGFGAGGAGPHLADPSRLTGFIRALQPMGVPVVLLHCYPYHRQAAHLADVHPHVHVDVGPALTRGAAGAWRAMDELLELAPFHKQLFGSGCAGVAETCHLGAFFFRRSLGGALKTRLDAGEWSTADAARVAHMIGSGNARRVYRL
ncbi:amidohydrolase family protein [Nonomuraea cavernae]|uniref:Amidohydrolase n=1 Tax=Nonomuraea cavernae TaxID=2045107 RepID=A0A917YSL7_9ACTN|nr:amidohydrolase family protein [Nonomuraea cavernae]MCA2184461.1 amidohydrolase [Nonomuraea cavernae]GGO63725.1 amidohydrolase [Nonomuraea cavernae]